MITYPLNNIDYTAEDAELFHCTRTSGIWADDSFSISVTGADNNVTISTGIAWIRNEEFSGKVTALKTAKVLDLGIADGVYPRIDVIAIQFNANSNETDVVVKRGTPATNPVRPAIVRTGAVYELYLASIYRPAGATAITASNITDLRMDDTVCGLMADSVTKVDMSAIEAQVRAFIDNLQKEIDEVKNLSGLMFETEWTEGGVIPVSKGGTGANNASSARANLGASSTGANTYNGHQTLENAKYIYGKLADETPIRLLGMSANDNLLFGDATKPDEPIYIYGKLNLNNALPVEEGGTGVTTLPDLIKALCGDGTGNSEPAYVIGFDSGYEGSGYTSIKNLRNTMGLGNTTGALPIANGGTGATTPSGIISNLGLKKKLWSGTWANGTVEIPNTDDYYMYMIDFVGHATPIFVGRNGTYIRGTGGYAATSTIELYNVTITRNGNLWTLEKANRLTLNPNASNGGLVDVPIENIWGII